MINIIDTTRKPFPEFNDKGEYVGNREITAVLTEDVNHLKAAYAGFAERGNEEAIARGGSKQTFSQAKRWFPYLDKKEYRR
jgi:hypothetical protein